MNLTERTELTSDSTGPSPTEVPPSRKSNRLWLLFAAHVLLSLFFSIWSALEQRIPFVLEYLLVVPVFGFIFAQSSLLGFWAAFSPARLWVRLVGLIAAILYLEYLLIIGEPDEDFTWLAAMAAGGITAVFGLIRWRYAELVCLSQQATQSDQEGLKFSIRGLMFFTFVVATMTIGINELRESVSGGVSLLGIFIWSLCFIVVGLAGVWAGLGLARPALRSLVVLLISAILGILFVYLIDQPDWETHFYIVSILLLQAGVLIASLLVVRSCGYRLVRKPKPEVELLD